VDALKVDLAWSGEGAVPTVEEREGGREGGKELVLD